MSGAGALRSRVRGTAHERCRAGGRQERLARRNDQPARRRRRAGARGLRDHRGRLPRLPRDRRAGRAHRAGDGQASTSTTSWRWRPPASASASGSRARSCPRDSKRRSRHGLCEAVRRRARPSVAVRSSATAEDLPDASFAGQQETFLNIHGLDHVLDAVRHVFASLYNDRAIAYRVHKGFVHADVALSAGIQRMVRSDLGASGVMFTLDTESGLRQVSCSSPRPTDWARPWCRARSIRTSSTSTRRASRPAGPRSCAAASAPRRSRWSSPTASRPAIRSRTVSVPEPDRRRFAINDAEVEELARYAVIIEKHYGRPMDIEWGRDGVDGKIYILQARPETVKANASHDTQQRFRLKSRSEILVVGPRHRQPRRHRAGAPDPRSAARWTGCSPGDVLVTDMTDPDWEPVMKRAAAIVTNRGGRTCHAAIIARELGIPAVVGCGDATQVLQGRQEVTVSCAEGDTGFVYRGRLEVEVIDLSLQAMPKPPVKISMNVGNPELAFEFQRLPNDGVGLARLEFIIARMIGVHPQGRPGLSGRADRPAGSAIETHARGLCRPGELLRREADRGHRDAGRRRSIRSRSSCACRISSPTSIRAWSAASKYEPHEENPMLGFRGASRYIASSFRECFELECRALRKVRDEMGLTNVEIMVPFVRTVDEARAGGRAAGRQRARSAGVNGLRVIMMCEIPSNAMLADQFLRAFRRLLDRLERHDPADARRWTAIPASWPVASTSAIRRSRRMLAHGHPGLPRGGQVRRASAARGRPTTPISRSGWWRRASTPSRSIPTPWSRPGCSSRKGAPAVAQDGMHERTARCLRRGFSSYDSQQP